MDFFAALVSTLGVVFAIIDPFGYVPIFIAMTSDDSEQQRKKMLLKACTTAFTVLVVSTLLGNHILRFFGISIPALQISGGIILFVIGIEMVKILPISEKITALEENEGIKKQDISIIPLAIPMLSGPASIATVIILGSQKINYSMEVHVLAIITSIFITLAFTFWILRFAGKILAVVGHTGINVMTRIMGLLLSAMAIQFIIDGYHSIKL